MEPRNILAWNISETRRYILIRKMSQHIRISICDHMGFSGGLAVKNLPANAGDTGSIPGPGRPPGGENGNPLQYSCWEIPWTEEPGGLQLIGFQGIRHDLVTKQQ